MRPSSKVSEEPRGTSCPGPHLLTQRCPYEPKAQPLPKLAHESNTGCQSGQGKLLELEDTQVCLQHCSVYRRHTGLFLALTLEFSTSLPSDADLPLTFGHFVITQLSSARSRQAWN